jgi:hypothetical protein
MVEAGICTRLMMHDFHTNDFLPEAKARSLTCQDDRESSKRMSTYVVVVLERGTSRAKFEIGAEARRS